jgi:hypothetical protein
MKNTHYSTFNVAELTPIDGLPGAVRLSRFPGRLEPMYSLPGGKIVWRQSTGCEIRLVPAGPRVIFRLSAPEATKVAVFQGDFWQAGLEMEPGRVYEFAVEVADNLLHLPENARGDCLFSPEVLRLRVERGTIYLHAIDTHGAGSREPSPSEQPAKRWLAWGSSITHADTYGYIFQAAHRLGVDVLDKGLSGSCGAEPEVAEFLVNECEWDFATCEWGVNMRDSVEPDDFRQRVHGCLDHFVPTGKPVFLLTIFPSNADIGLAEESVCKRVVAFNHILREAVEARSAPNLHLIEGSVVVKRWNWLGGDLVHPTHDGHNRMGEELARILQGLL